MSDKATINVLLHGGQIFHPGQQIKGSVQIWPNQMNLKSRKIELKLEWFTEGKGDRDGEVIEKKELNFDEFKGMAADEFRFMLPNEPWSYTGHYINIIWSVTVHIHVPLRKGVKHEHRFILHPDPEP